MDCGVDDDWFCVDTLPAGKVEILDGRDRYFSAALLPVLGGE